LLADQTDAFAGLDDDGEAVIERRWMRAILEGDAIEDDLALPMAIAPWRQDFALH